MFVVFDSFITAYLSPTSQPAKMNAWLLHVPVFWYEQFYFSVQSAIESGLLRIEFVNNIGF
jgi:hypothetical protein